MKIYDYFRSSAAYRLRIALELKGMTAERVPVNLREGEQHTDAYRGVNAQKLVPTLETERGRLSQSLAIIEYLDAVDSDRLLLPTDPWLRAQQRAMALTIACDVHPLNNLRVLNYLRDELQQNDEAVTTWIWHWIGEGFTALEAVAQSAPFLGGEQPMLADVVLVPQVYNARRYEMPLDAYPQLVAIADRCNALEAFARAAPAT